MGDKLGGFMKLVALKFLGNGGDFIAMWQYMEDLRAFWERFFNPMLKNWGKIFGSGSPLFILILVVYAH